MSSLRRDIFVPYSNYLGYTRHDWRFVLGKLSRRPGYVGWSESCRENDLTIDILLLL